MTLYFENKRSGGGHVTSIRFCRDDDYAVLELQEHSCKLHHPYQVDYYSEALHNYTKLSFAPKRRNLSRR